MIELQVVSIYIDSFFPQHFDDYFILHQKYFFCLEFKKFSQAVFANKILKDCFLGKYAFSNLFIDILVATFLFM